MEFLDTDSINIKQVKKSEIELEGNSFLFMGCWNKGYCKHESEGESKKENDLHKTVQSIKKFLTFTSNTSNKISKPSKIFIAGDNYYPDKKEKPHKHESNTEIKSKPDKKDKTEKVKITNIENLKSGFDCINSMDIDKYFLFGNHDFEKTMINDNDENKECHNLTNQLDYGSDNENNDNMAFFDFKSDCLPHIYKNGTLIVMIDSTMYDINDNNDKSLDCYAKLLTNNDNNGGNMLEFIKLNQTQRANNLINYYKNASIKITNIIFMAHHPVFGLKLKKNELQVDCYTGLIELEMLFYDAFHNKSAKIKYYHFCADIHQFQVSTIKINNNFEIKQYIIGTGGAEKDAEIDDSYINDANRGKTKIKTNILINNKQIKVEIDFKKTFLSKAENGFMLCSVINDNVTCSIFYNIGVNNLVEHANHLGKSVMTRINSKIKTRRNQKTQTNSKTRRNSKTKYYSLPLSFRKSDKNEKIIIDNSI